MVPTREDRSTEIRTLGEAVDPGDGVSIVGVTFEHAIHAVVDVDGALGVDDHLRGLDRLELECRLGDDAGETHAARRRPEHLRVVVGADREHAALGVTSFRRVTESVNEPCRNLPWMSEAMAPPTVTWRVPGTTIGNQPSGRKTRINISMLTPASTVHVPLATSSSSTRSSRVQRTTLPPAFWAASP